MSGPRAQYYKAWRAKNSDYVKAFDKSRATPERVRTNRLRKYGLTLEQYNQMLEAQNHCCAICGEHESEQKNSLSVDHNHTTGAVRALLCDACNTAIGLLRESPQILAQAVEYLLRYTNQA